MIEEDICVLYVDPHEERGVRTASALEEWAAIEATTESTAEAAVSELTTRAIDCLVSSDVDSFRAVRAVAPEIPYVLFTEGLSADCIYNALELGVTEYVPRDGADAERAYSLLTDRIASAVTQKRATQRVSDLERITSVVRSVHRQLVYASTRFEIDQRVCDVISQSDPYVFAWIGEHDSESERVTGRAAAGVEDGYLESITITTDGSSTAQGPTGRAVRTHEIHVLQNILEDPAYEPWREEAVKRGYRSSAAVPLVYDGTLYGVLNIYSNRTAAFDSNEQELLEELGETIAKAHHDLRKHEEARRFQRAVEQAADAIFITDIDGTIEYVNPSFEELTGYSSSEAVGRTPRLLRSGVHDRAYYQRMWETILAGDIWHEEIVNVRKSGERYHTEQTIAPITRDAGDIEGFVSIHRDITDRKKHQRELQQTEQRLSLAIDTADAGVWEWDLQSEEMIWDASMAALVGLSTESFGGTLDDFLARVSADDREMVSDAFARREGFELEFRFRHESGDFIWILTRSKLLTDPEGRPERMIGVGIDISEQIDQRKQLQVMDRVLRHNLRNDMTAILGYAETIRDESEQFKPEAETILSEGQALLKTVNKEREIVEIISNPPEKIEIDAVSVCRSAVEAVRDTYPEVDIDLDLPTEVTVLAVTQLRRAIQELLENAITHSDRETPVIELAVETREGDVRIAIADDGPGIPDEEVAVLTREQDLKPLFHGSGLGLWLVNWIIRRSDGLLGFEENEPRGSVVTIELLQPP